MNALQVNQLQIVTAVHPQPSRDPQTMVVAFVNGLSEVNSGVERAPAPPPARNDCGTYVGSSDHYSHFFP
jgi:hypothetical protein